MAATKAQSDLANGYRPDGTVTFLVCGGIVLMVG